MRCVLEYVDEPLNVKCKELFIEKFCGYRAHEMFGKDSWKNPDAKPERSATRRLSTDHSDLNRNNSIRNRLGLGLQHEESHSGDSRYQHVPQLDGHHDVELPRRQARDCTPHLGEDRVPDTSRAACLSNVSPSWNVRVAAGGSR
eukprot:2733851-Prymnesium_polylepis.2